MHVHLPSTWSSQSVSVTGLLFFVSELSRASWCELILFVKEMLLFILTLTWNFCYRKMDVLCLLMLSPVD
jgi:hypothetical protein